MNAKNGLHNHGDQGTFLVKQFTITHRWCCFFNFFSQHKNWYFFHFALQPDCEEKIILQPQGNQ